MIVALIVLVLQPDDLEACIPTSEPAEAAEARRAEADYWRAVGVLTPGEHLFDQSWWVENDRDLMTARAADRRPDDPPWYGPWWVPPGDIAHQQVQFLYGRLAHMRVVRDFLIQDSWETTLHDAEVEANQRRLRFWQLVQAGQTRDTRWMYSAPDVKGGRVGAWKALRAEFPREYEMGEYP